MIEKSRRKQIFDGYFDAIDAVYKEVLIFQNLSVQSM